MTTLNCLMAMKTNKNVFQLSMKPFSGRFRVAPYWLGYNTSLMKVALLLLTITAGPDRWPRLEVEAALYFKKGQSSSAETSSGLNDPVMFSRHVFLQNVVIDTSVAPAISQPRFKALEVDNDRTNHSYLVHMRGPIQSQDRKAVEHVLGHSLVRYIPHNSFVVYTSSLIAQEISNLEAVLWMDEWKPEFKLSSSLAPLSRFQLLDTVPNPEPPNEHVDPSIELVLTLTGTESAPESNIDRWRSDALDEIDAEFGCAIVEVDLILVSNILLSGNAISSDSELGMVIDWFLSQSEVHHVGVVEPITLFNYYVKPLVQSDEPELPTEDLLFERHDIRGQGHIVSMGDSGVFTEGCYFQDPDHSVNFTAVNLSAPLNVTVPMMVTMNHRKFAQYIVSNKGDELDLAGHGTHVAGTLIGNSLSQDQFLQNHNGMAPDARLAVFDIENAGIISVPLGLDKRFFPYSYAIGARVFSNSWGTKTAPFTSQYTLNSRSVDAFAWEHKDALMLFAAGNDGTNTPGSVTPPSTAKNCISVGSTLSSINMFRATHCPGGFEEDANMCSYYNTLERFNHTQDLQAVHSSLGYAADGRIKPDVLTVGEQVISAGKSSCSEDRGGLHHRRGTSMSTPSLAGNMVLVRQYFEEGFYPSGSRRAQDVLSPSAALLKAIVIGAAFEISHRLVLDDGTIDFTEMQPAPNQYQGFGRVKLKSALYFADDPRFHHRVFLPRGESNQDLEMAESGESATFTFCVSHVYSVHPPRFVLVWTDYPAEEMSASNLVNNLDLQVRADGESIHPNNLNGPDTTNTVERVILPAKVQPNVEIEVTILATSIPSGPQPYALLASGRIVESSCAEEFPGGVVPADRLVDVSAPKEENESRRRGRGGRNRLFGLVAIAGVCVAIVLAIGCWRACRKSRKATAIPQQNPQQMHAQQYPVHQRYPVQHQYPAQPQVIVMTPQQPMMQQQ